MKLLCKDNIIMFYARDIRFGVFDEPDLEKWALLNEDDEVIMYVVDDGYSVVDIADDIEIPEDLTAFKYQYSEGIISLNPEWVDPPLSTEEQVQVQGQAIASLYQSSEVATIVFVTLAESGTFDDTTIAEHPEVFTEWQPNQHYVVGNIRRYGERLFRCLTEHDSLDSWTPENSPSLWVGISDPNEEYPLWSQPIGSTDAYMKGDKVTYDNKHWVSDYDNNTWTPSVFGWIED